MKYYDVYYASRAYKILDQLKYTMHKQTMGSRFESIMYDVFEEMVNTDNIKHQVYLETKKVICA